MERAIDVTVASKPLCPASQHAPARIRGLMPPEDAACARSEARPLLAVLEALLPPDHVRTDLLARNATRVVRAALVGHRRPRLGFDAY
jgi:hypothetical protein